MKRSLGSSLLRCVLLLAVATAGCGGGSSDDGGNGGEGGDNQGGDGGDNQGGGGGGDAKGGSGGGAGKGGSGGGNQGGGNGGSGGGNGGSGGMANGGAAGMANGGAAGMANGGAGGMPDADYDACPPGKPCKVLLIGDAWGAGVGKYLMPAATQDNHPNWTIQGASNAFSTIIPSTITTNKPQVVVMWFGGEDLWNNTALNEAPMRYLGLVDKVIEAAPDAYVIVVAPPPLDPNWDQTKNNQWNFKAYNFEVAISKLVGDRSRAGKHVGLVRMFSFLGGSGVALLKGTPNATEVNAAVSGMNAAYTGFNKYTLQDNGYKAAGPLINQQLKRYIP